MTRRLPHEYNWERMEFDETLLTKHFTPKASRDIRGFVVHHMMILDRDKQAMDALDACYRVWQDRPASAHYGVEGEYVRQFVWDKDYAWANGDTWANDHMIAVEHANKTLDMPGTKNDYIIDTSTWQTGARLIAQGHVMYNLVPKINVTVTKHSDYSATACPGPYMDLIFNQYFSHVESWYNHLTGRGAAPTQPEIEGLTMADMNKIIEHITAQHVETRKQLFDFISGFNGPIGSDVKDIREQLTGGRDAGDYSGWPQLANLTVTDALAALAAAQGLGGFDDRRDPELIEAVVAAPKVDEV